MADVYRKGTKSVHRSILLEGSRFDVTACNLDPGGQWGSDVPAGARCPTCFVGDGPAKAGVAAPAAAPRRTNRGKVAAAAGGVAALALLGAVWASQPVSSPVSSFIAISTASVESAFSALPIVTPGPSVTPTEAPALTPSPFPSDSGGIVDNATRIVVRNIYIQSQPSPQPTKEPGPTPKPCVHPGTHLGVDPCKWPHN